jgi:adenosylhomocysteine nucleosidase
MESIWFSIDKSLIDLCISIESKKNFSHKIHFGKAVTGEKFITHRERDDIIKRFSPLCVDMESASVAHVCYAHHTKLLVVRSITDHTGTEGHNDFKENVVDCSLLSVNFIKEFLKQLQK